MAEVKKDTNTTRFLPSSSDHYQLGDDPQNTPHSTDCDCHWCSEDATPQPTVTTYTAEQIIQALAAFWSHDTGGAVCPIYPGAYLMETDEPIRDIILRTAGAAKAKHSGDAGQISTEGSTHA
jgi:hypothetical protein